MKEDIIKELAFGLKINKLKAKDLAKFCNVSKPTIYKLINEGKGKLELLEKARKFIKENKKTEV